MNCPKCEYALSPFDKACPRCSQLQKAPPTTAVSDPRQAAVSQPQSVAHPQSVSQSQGAPHRDPPCCVACGSQAIQKVSGLYRSGAWSSETNSLGVAYGRSSRGQSITTVHTTASSSAGATHLAQALAPPPRPQIETSFAQNTVIACGILAFASWFAVNASFSQKLVGPNVCGLIFLGLASVFTVGLLAAIPWAIQTARAERAELPVLLERWQALMRRWQQLYYCSRCDRVFNPVSGRYAATSAVYSILRQDLQDGASRL